MTTKDAIVIVCDNLCRMLLKKNESYGDAVMNPIRIFSKLDAKEQIALRIDDKLSRLARGKEFEGDDDILDLTGYLIMELARREILNESARSEKR